MSCSRATVFRTIRTAAVTARRTVLFQGQRNHFSQSTVNDARTSNLQRRNGRLQASSSSSSASSEPLPYGMQRVDYTKPPPVWLPPPPPPPIRNPVRRYFGRVVLAAVTGLFVWIYFNQDESVYEYWRKVEQGNVPIDDDDDEDWEDDDLDLSNVDEWEDEEDKGKRT